jgi:hypothetical protein
MAYIGDPLKGFGDYQKNEYKAPNATNLGHINNGQLKGYEKAAANSMQEYFGDAEGLDIEEADNPFDGADAFAGYLSSADEDVIDDFVEDALDDEESGLGHYGESATGELESWHTYFHQASLASSEQGMIAALAKAVMAVPNGTLAETKRQYYNLAMQMLHRRKRTDIGHMDLERVELASNLGWLINPNVPKKGGFLGLVSKSLSKLGPALDKDSKEDLKRRHAESLGVRLKSNLRKEGRLGSLGLAFGDNKTMMYLGLGVAAAAAYYWYNNKPAPARKKRRRKKK